MGPLLDLGGMVGYRRLDHLSSRIEDAEKQRRGCVDDGKEDRFRQDGDQEVVSWPVYVAEDKV